jgi:hypothetical protein
MMPIIPDHQFQRRKMLFELGDMEWVPSLFRDGLRAFLNGTHALMKYYKPWTCVLAEVLKKTGIRQVVVLGAGGGFLSRLVQQELATTYHLDVKFILTDINPPGAAVEKWNNCKNMEYVSTPVDMMNVPAAYEGIRVIFNAFHHLDPKQAQMVLRDAYEAQMPICIFEYTRNSLVGILSCVLYPFFNLLIAPLARPFKWSHLFFTYLLPIYPLMIAFDGLASNLRTYGKNELLGMVSELGNGYLWSVGYRTVGGHPTQLTHFVGLPVSKPTANVRDSFIRHKTAKTPSLTAVGR